ncbi:hypothetical protein [Terribacillus saccharophilus]|uniref:hypothetical protein n=1 Tax=Terribacillus saccharophilus TaxID=361277 RepID=UPI002989EA5C|nr:hypothetical protein [Terribacillus saccharophilus]MCM3225229.1 hypothetical protein [Terribacillus saccharophilus]MEC0281254.1 hypothetical protein [Terribacillus saccharophilus]MEC0289454.1 hypothetical protein [Terribacillus saccharophilus]
MITHVGTDGTSSPAFFVSSFMGMVALFNEYFELCRYKMFEGDVGGEAFYKVFTVIFGAAVFVMLLGILNVLTLSDSGNITVGESSFIAAIDKLVDISFTPYSFVLIVGTAYAIACGIELFFKPFISYEQKLEKKRIKDAKKAEKKKGKISHE